jgi:hypothetical protein
VGLAIARRGIFLIVFSIVFSIACFVFGLVAMLVAMLGLLVCSSRATATFCASCVY